MVASSICGRQGLRSQVSLVGVGGWNSGVPLVLPDSSYLQVYQVNGLVLNFESLWKCMSSNVNQSLVNFVQ